MAEPMAFLPARPYGETVRMVLLHVLEYMMTQKELASAIPNMYLTCASWREALKAEGFCMKTFSLCRVLSRGNGASKFGYKAARIFQQLQATIRRQLERNSDQVEAERAWWLDARSLVQRCRSVAGSGTVWSWLQLASQEPDTGRLSRRAAATAKILMQPLVSWPGKPKARFLELCTLTGHSCSVHSVAYSPDGKHIVSASGDYRRDNTVRIWDAASGKEVGATGPCHARYQFSLTVAVGRSAR